MSTTSGVSSQVISLPQGGGAMQGIGESFSADLFTGTGNFTVPLAVPAGRGGFEPELSLVYSTGGGNGPFGLGWDLSVPGIARKTSKGLPRYDDARDTFVLSGQEDLVAVEAADAATRYRPRTEGLFARIVHHHDATNDFWEVHTKSGLVSRYGTAQSAGRDLAVVADPDDRSRVFAWKLTQTEDPFGNRISYRYGRDLAHDGLRRFEQLYLEEIGYVDYVDASHSPRFLMTVAFDYEDGSGAGPGRPDPFSHHRAGFEIRTQRRCQRIEIRTHTDDAASADAKGTLVRRYELVYVDERVAAGELSADLLPPNGVSLLSQIRVTGHDERREAEADRVEALPALEFGYTAFEPTRQAFVPVGGELPANSLADTDLELADLSGNGLPDIVQLNGVARYWANAGDGTFMPPRTMQQAPAGAPLADPNVRLLDADGDGRIDLLVNRPGLSGYFPLRGDGEWDERSFRAYRQAPSFPLADPNLALVDLDGDGATDAVRAGTRFECFLQDPEQGWRELRRVPRRALEEFPNVNFADPRVQWADMTGDGLQDVVLIHHRSVEYWPNQGYGDWGPRVRMRASPELPAGYDPRRVLLGDVDGDGCADLVYVDDRRVLLWINQSGNGWSRPLEVPATPRVTTPEAVQLVDLLGSGIRGVLWSADANGQGRDHAFFLDFTGAVKPYLLDEMDNHMGAVTRVQYAPSTHFYLEDATRRECRWHTPLPFPVQVVARVEAIDAISRGKLTTEYTYHHGYWDGNEREFRGFGRVDQRDTEHFERFNTPGLHGEGAAFDQIGVVQFSPPLLTKTWFHLGSTGEKFNDGAEASFADEYWSEDASLLERPEATVQLLRSLTTKDRSDALRSLRSHMLRSELYALDGTPREGRPYTVTENQYGIRDESPRAKGDGRPRIFFPHLVAQRTTQWERGAEPLIRFTFTDVYDVHGQPSLEVSLAVPRGRDVRVATAAGEPYLGTCTVTRYAQPAKEGRLIVDRVAATTAYEIVNDGSPSLFDLLEAVRSGEAHLEVIEQAFNYYDGDVFAGRSLGQVGDFGALVRSESLVLTEAILRDAYAGADPAADVLDSPPYLAPEGPPTWTDEYPQPFRDLVAPLAGYTFHPGDADHERGYFVQTDRRQYDFHEAPGGRGRGLVTVTRDALANDTSTVYDEFGLLPVEAVDSAGLRTRAVNDYRVFQPRLVIDVNDNQTALTYTPLGLLETTAMMGKVGRFEGDTPEIPGTRFTYDLSSFDDSSPGGRKPVSVRTRRRVHHVNDAAAPLADRDEVIETVEYSDGFGRLIQTRSQAEDVIFGDARFGDGTLPNRQGEPTTANAISGKVNSDLERPNIVVNGWQVRDNKGRVVERYEPFFATGWDYDPPADAQLGQHMMMFYDPLGRVVRARAPNGSEDRFIYGVPLGLADPETLEPTPWETYSYDANDNAGRTHPDDTAGYADHWNTPTSTVLDPLGRTVVTIERDRESPPNVTDRLPHVVEARTQSHYDIRGNVVRVTDALDRTAFQYVYDLADRPLRIESIDAGVRRIVVDAAGNDLEQRSGRGALVLQVYDVLHRPTRLWARDDSTSPVTLRQRLEYGDAGNANQPSVLRAAAKAANRLGELHRHHDEAGLLTLATFDFKGNILEQVRNVISDEAILAVFPSAAETDPDWQITPFRVNWEPPGGSTLAAREASVLDPTPYESSAEYDALGRIVRVRYPRDVEGKRKQLVASYDRGGSLEQIQLDGKRFIEHIAYNAKGQRTLVALSNGIMTRYSYDRRTFRMLRLRSERYTKPASDSPTYEPTGPALQDLAYTQDLAGNVLSIVDRTPGCGVRANPEAGLVSEPELRALLTTGDALVRRFAYDARYRLVSASGRECRNGGQVEPWLDRARCGFNGANHATPTQDNAPSMTGLYDETYHYDSTGNLLQLRHRGPASTFVRRFSLATGTNRLSALATGSTSLDYGYDPDGNMLSESQSRHFEWDHSDRMIVFRTQVEKSEPSVHVHYLYDAAGERAKKVVRRQGGGTAVTTYINGTFEHRRWSSNGMATSANNHVHVMDDQRRVALVRVGPAHGDDESPAVQYHLEDHIGSSSLVISDDGRFANREEYTPFGETSFGGFTTKRYRFTGRERDEESGLNYHRSRYFAPWLARWVSCDPIIAVDNAAEPSHYSQLYSYTRNRPLLFTDADGEQSKEAIATMNWLQELADKIPQRGYPVSSLPGPQGTAAHLTLETAITTGQDISKTAGANFQRVAPEVLIDNKGIIRSVGVDPGSLGRKAKGWRSIDVAVLKEGYLNNLGPKGFSTLTGIRASDAIQFAVDYKTGNARLNKVTAMEKLINAPYVPLRQKGDLAQTAVQKQARLAKIGKVVKGASKSSMLGKLGKGFGTGAKFLAKASPWVSGAVAVNELRQGNYLNAAEQIPVIGWGIMLFRWQPKGGGGGVAVEPVAGGWIRSGDPVGKRDWYSPGGHRIPEG